MCISPLIDHTSVPVGMSSFRFGSLSRIAKQRSGGGGLTISMPAIDTRIGLLLGRRSSTTSPTRNRSSPSGLMPGTNTIPRPRMTKVSDTTKRHLGQDDMPTVYAQLSVIQPRCPQQPVGSAGRARVGLLCGIPSSPGLRAIGPTMAAVAHARRPAPEPMTPHASAASPAALVRTLR